MHRIILAALIAGALAPPAIATDPASYDGKTVTVTGTVSHSQTSSTPMGTVAGFQLCDSKCLVVIDKTNRSRSNGAPATVTGTFRVTFKGPRKTFNDAIVVGRQLKKRGCAPRARPCLTFVFH